MLVDFLYVPYMAVILTHSVCTAVLSVHQKQHLAPTCKYTINIYPT